MFGGSPFFPGCYGGQPPQPPRHPGPGHPPGGHPGALNPTHVETVRSVFKAADSSFGNGDGKLDSREAGYAARILKFESPSLGNLFGAVATALNNNNRTVDRDGDGKLAYEKASGLMSLFGGSNVDELTKLAQNSGSPHYVEQSDFGRQGHPRIQPYFGGYGG